MTTTSEEIIKTIQAALAHARARAHRRKDTNVSIYPHIPTNVFFLFFLQGSRLRTHTHTHMSEIATVVLSNYRSEVDPTLFFFVF